MEVCMHDSLYAYDGKYDYLVCFYRFTVEKIKKNEQNGSGCNIGLIPFIVFMQKASNVTRKNFPFFGNFVRKENHAFFT